jgi:dinuclear metal center protein, YbgI/SA1388 family
MFVNGHTVMRWMETFAPARLAVPDDRIGLQLGTADKEVRAILVALDVTEEVADEAIAAGANWIVAHHAIIYRPLKNLRTDTPAGRLYEKLIKHDIAVYIAHTNLDAAEGGVNDLMARALGLHNCRVLETVYEEPLYKLVVFVPETHLEPVMDAVFDAGAGAIGEYSRCGFYAAGTGTFLPGEAANPFIGEAGRTERVAEYRLETIVPEPMVADVERAMRQAHPYEEPAFDWIPLRQTGRRYGLGQCGDLPGEVTLAELAEQVKKALDVDRVRVVGPLDRRVRRAAVLGGSGSRYIGRALSAGADVLITGDIDYHSAHDALAAGLCLIDPGHNAEKIVKRALADYLRKQAEAAASSTKVLASEVDTDPFAVL